MKKKLLALAIVLALVAAMIVPMAISASGPTIVDVSNLQPSYSAPNGGGVWAAYYGPPSYTSPVSPGSTAFVDGKQAGIIYAGVTKDPILNDYEDEGLLAFQVPSVDVSTFAVQALTYVVENQSGLNPVWVRIRLVGGVQYQFVPATNPAGWHTVDAEAGMWQLMDDSGNATGSPMTLSQVASANVGAKVDRVYLTLGIGDTYNVSPGVGTVGWVNKVTIDTTEYDFVVAQSGSGTTTPVNVGGIVTLDPSTLTFTPPQSINAWSITPWLNNNYDLVVGTNYAVAGAGSVVYAQGNDGITGWTLTVACPTNYASTATPNALLGNMYDGTNFLSTAIEVSPDGSGWSYAGTGFNYGNVTTNGTTTLNLYAQQVVTVTDPQGTYSIPLTYTFAPIGP